jgi:Transglutaminase-like superfamily
VKALRQGALVVEAWAELITCRARLRLPRLLRAGSFLRQELQPRELRTVTPDGQDALGRAFARALQAQPGHTGCLARSLALRRFLARNGGGARLRLGLKRSAGRLTGHAWVEVNGRIASGDEAFVRSFHRLRAAAGDEAA